MVFKSSPDSQQVLLLFRRSSYWLMQFWVTQQRPSGSINFQPALRDTSPATLQRFTVMQIECRVYHRDLIPHESFALNVIGLFVSLPEIGEQM